MDTTLFRPVGQPELELISRARWRAIRVEGCFVLDRGEPIRHGAFTERLVRRVVRDFGRNAGRALGRIADAVGPRSETERIAAAITAFAGGDRHRLDDACALALLDWRDLLLSVPGFAHEGWERHVGELLDG